jgi:hypothetical protein
MGAVQKSDCCWIVLATTGCSTKAASLESFSVANSQAKDDCCWIVLATTGCST